MDPSAVRLPARGFTLTELVVAMGLGLFVLAWLLGFLGRLVHGEAMLSGRLAIDRALAELAADMRSTIRRAVPLAAGRSERFARVSPDCLLFRTRSIDGRIRPAGYRLRRGQLQRRTSAGCPAGSCRTCRQGHWVTLTDRSEWRVTGLSFRVQTADLVEVVVEGRRRYPPRIARRLDLHVLARP